MIGFGQILLAGAALMMVSEGAGVVTNYADAEPFGAPEDTMFDLIVLGAGSGGMASARRAANLYQARVALVEGGRLGGTCVNLGCVPKKVMYNAASIADAIRDAKAYGFTNVVSGDELQFNWLEFKNKRDAYVHRLNGIYDTNLKKDHVTVYSGYGKLIAKDAVEVSGGALESPVTIRGKRIIIATGTHAIVPDNVPGAELGITSDGFFALESQPKRVGIVGSGYVGVELAGVLHSLGSKVDLWCRKDGVLTHFDSLISTTLTSEMQRIGINIHSHTDVKRIERNEDGSLRVCYHQGDHHPESGGSEKCLDVDTLIWAIGRAPNTKNIGLKAVGVEQDADGHIKVDEYQNTTVENIFAVGDVIGKFPLTPVAIAAGRRLIDRLFGAKSDSRLVYENVPSVVFSHPTPCASIGLTEEEARRHYAEADLKIYQTKFFNMYNSLFEPDHKSISKYKLICVGPEQRIIGLHLIGEGSDEILQGFGVAIKMGATKADFERVVPIHPTAAEEVVNMR